MLSQGGVILDSVRFHAFGPAFGLHTRPIQGRTRSAAGQHPQLEVTAACHPFSFTVFLISSLSLPASLKPTIRPLASGLKRASEVLGMAGCGSALGSETEPQQIDS